MSTKPNAQPKHLMGSMKSGSQSGKAHPAPSTPTQSKSSQLSGSRYGNKK